MEMKNSYCMAGFMPLDIPDDEEDGFEYSKSWILVFLICFFFFFYEDFLYFLGRYFLEKICFSV